MGYDVSGKTVLVTGANRGIGRAIVQGAIQHGAIKVYAAVRKLDSADSLVKEFGNRCGRHLFGLRRFAIHNQRCGNGERC